MRGKLCPNCIDSGANSQSMVPLTLDVPSSDCDYRLSIRHGLRCSWGTAVMQDSFGLSPNNPTVYTTGKHMLNLSCTRCCISPWMNDVISGVHADTWGPFLIDHSRDHYVQAGPVCTGIPSFIYFRSGGAVGCRTVSDSAPWVPRCLESIKAAR